MTLGHSHPTDPLAHTGNPLQATADAEQTTTPEADARRPGFHTRHPTRDAVLDAIQEVAPTDTLQQLQAQVSAHLQAHTSRADPAKPLLVVVAEPHDSRLAKLAQLAVLRHFRAHGRACTFLVEQDPGRFDDSVNGFRQGAEGNALRRAKAVFGTALAGRPVASHDTAWVEAREAMTAVQCHLADRMKVEVRAYDVARSTAQSQDERESAMGEAIASWARFPGQVVVVQAGDHHAAKFHEDFQHTAQVIGICCLTEDVPPSPLRHELRRKSYLLSHPEVLKLRGPALEGDGSGFFGFAKEILASFAAGPAAPTAAGWPQDPTDGPSFSRTLDALSSEESDGDGPGWTAWQRVAGQGMLLRDDQAPVSLAFLDGLLWPSLLAMEAPRSPRSGSARRPHRSGTLLHALKPKERSFLKGW